MTLQVPILPKHSYSLIAVPSERMDKPVSDYTTIESNGESFKIIEWVTIYKNENMPSSLVLLATGKDLSHSEIWNAFKNSNKIVFFICEKTDSNTIS